MKLTTMLESRIRESYQIQLFTTFCNQKLTESCRDHFDSQKFQFHVLIVFLGAVRPLFLLWDFFWIRLVRKGLQIMLQLPRLLCLSNYFMEFKIANMAKILYENIKRKLTIVSYRFLALTIPNLVVLYHTPRPQHCD